ncbi:MAG: Alcohol dehydrogenase zinc-binding domain protein [Alphaproteobacteria bacterium]|nr:Alcohol dehydrogenase zinc-binding domain protein [Alphaproteobacteria bacterium]
MRAVQCHEYGDPSRLTIEDIAEPVAGPGEVIVQVEAVGLGYVDALRVRGGYQVKDPLPFIPGNEFAGRVVELGEGVPESVKGRRVMGVSRNGALAERIRLPARDCVTIPDALSSPAAGGFIVSYCTALYGLQTCGRLQPGETLAVLGAAGGVGLAAIDVGKAMGARVIALASSAAKRELALRSGADLAVDYSVADWRKHLQEAAGAYGIDMIYDPVGAPYSETAFRCLRPGGRFLVVGFAAGSIAAIPLNLPLLKRSAIVGVDWGGFVRDEPQGNVPLLQQLAEWVEQGRMHPQATSQHPLEQAPSVLQALLERRSLGKPAILVTQ